MAMPMSAASAAHGDADVGCFEGGSVVDAVACHGYDVASGFEGADEAELLLRHHAGEDVA